jgi:HPt (histidine-containing phosphotransfer) domain-containing protein
LIQWSTALQSVEDDRVLLRELVAAFLEESPGRMTDIREAIGQRDATALQRAAHALKGSMQAIGALRPAQLALDLETLGEAGQLSQADAKFIALEQTMGLLLPALTRFVRDNPAP